MPENEPLQTLLEKWSELEPQRCRIEHQDVSLRFYGTWYTRSSFRLEVWQKVFIQAVVQELFETADEVDYHHVYDRESGEHFVYAADRDSWHGEPSQDKAVSWITARLAYLESGPRSRPDTSN